MNNDDNPNLTKTMNGPDSVGFMEAIENKIKTLIDRKAFVDVDREPWINVVFSFWDFLGDVGGLYDMLILIGGSLVSALQMLTGSGLNRYIIKHLFMVEKKKKE